MSRRTTFMVTIALGLALAGRAGAARAADTSTTIEAISTVQAVDAEQHVLVLVDGLHLRATDPALLGALHEGDIVRVVFTQEDNTLFLDRVETLDRAPSPYDQMHVGEGQSTGAKAPIGRRLIVPGDNGVSASPAIRTGDVPDAPDAFDGAREPEAP